MPAHRKTPADYVTDVEPNPNPARPAGHGMEWRHLVFANTFFQTGDKAAAVRAAGSRSKNPLVTASTWLNRDDVKRYLLALHEEVRDVAVRSNAALTEEAHQLIDEGIALAKKGDPMVGKNGSVITDPKTGDIVYKPNPMGLYKGAELKGRSVGMFTDVHRNESEMDGMSDEELNGFLVGAVSNNPALCKLMAKVPGVIREVHAADRHDQIEAGDGAVSEYGSSTSSSEDRLH